MKPTFCKEKIVFKETTGGRPVAWDFILCLLHAMDPTVALVYWQAKMLKNHIIGCHVGNLMFSCDCLRPLCITGPTLQKPLFFCHWSVASWVSVHHFFCLLIEVTASSILRHTRLVFSLNSNTFQMPCTPFFVRKCLMFMIVFVMYCFSSIFL